ncbi:hypothetical protein RB213_007865 [Colletotrichum asianum]
MMKPLWLAIVIAELIRSSTAILQYYVNILPISSTSSTLLSISGTSSSFDHHLIRIYDDQHVKQFVITHYRCVFLKFNLRAVDKFHFIKQRHFFQHKWIAKLQRASQLDAYCITYFFELECFFGFRLYNNALFKHNINFNLCRRVADYAFGGTDNIPKSHIKWLFFDFQHSRYLLTGNDGRTY